MMRQTGRPGAPSRIPKLSVVAILLVVVVSSFFWGWAFFGWWGIGPDQASKLSELTSGILGGAVVALAFLVLEVQNRSR